MLVSLHWHSALFRNTINLKPVVGTYGRRHSSVQCKKHPGKFPLDFPFIAYLLNPNYEKPAKCSLSFRRDKFLSILWKNWLVSKYTALLSKLIFRKKGKNKSKFRMVNLCNGGTKDFAELWEIIQLKIWTHFFIRQTKLFWIKLKYCSQTCSNRDLCKMITCLRRPILSLPRQIVIQLLLYKTTTCLMRPLFFVSQRKNSPSKTTIKRLYPAKKCDTIVRSSA